MANNNQHEDTISYPRDSGLRPVSRTPSCASDEPPRVRIDAARPINVEFRPRLRHGGRIEVGNVEADGAVGGNVGGNVVPPTLEIGNGEVGVTNEDVPLAPGHGYEEVGVTDDERTQAGVRERPPPSAGRYRVRVRHWPRVQARVNTYPRHWTCHDDMVCLRCPMADRRRLARGQFHLIKRK